MSTEFAKTYHVGLDENDIELFRNEYEGYEIKYRDGNNREQTLYSEGFPITTSPEMKTIITVLGEVIKIFHHNMVSIREGKIFKIKVDDTINENNRRGEHNKIKKQISIKFYFVNKNDNVSFDGRSPSFIELTPTLKYTETTKL